MVKTRSPLMSAEASGTLAKQLTFLNTRRGSTIRRRVLPRDPRTGGQLGRRNAFNFITKNWAAIASIDQATWSTLGAPADLTNYNAYTKENLRVWSAFRPPSEDYPATLDGTLANITGGPTAYDESPDIRIAIVSNLIDQNWGVIYFASLSTAFTTAVENCINLTRLTTTAVISSYWTPPNAGPWFFNARLFTTRGRLGPQLGEFTLP